MGIGEILVIAVIGLIVFGPDRLPKVAMQAAQMLRALREQANQAKAGLMEAADLDESTLRDIRDLDPRRALRDLAAPLDEARRSVDEALRPEDPAIPAKPAGESGPAAVDPRDIS